jgi:hypothetical protein
MSHDDTASILAPATGEVKPPRPLPTGVRHFPYVRFGQLLPRAAARVHQHSAFSIQHSAFSYQLSAISIQLSAFSIQLSAISFHLRRAARLIADG